MVHEIKTLYLIRHARPDFPLNQRYCIGSTDLPLGKLGHMQGVLLRKVWQDKTLPVFSSPLKRAGETAQYLTHNRQKVKVISGLEELDAGIWDGYSFSDIKQKWPELYANRANAFANESIPNAESQAAGLRRFKAAIRRVLELVNPEEKQIAVVAHGSIIRLFLQDLYHLSKTDLHYYPLPYANWFTLEVNQDRYRLVGGRQAAKPQLDDMLCRQLLEAANCSTKLISHCRAVADMATAITQKLNQRQYDFNVALLREAAYLHDMLRAEPNHEQLAAEYLKFLGYEAQAEIIAEHNLIKNTVAITESSILFIADKMIWQNQRVPLAVRFQKSLVKCQNTAARKAHDRREQYAYHLQDEINRTLGETFIL